MTSICSNDDSFDMGSTDSSDASTIEPVNDVPSKVKLILHHQLPGIELVSPVYAGDGVECYLSPDQTVDIGSTTQAEFNINLTQDEPIGILMYELKKQVHKDAISNEDETTCIRFYIVWKFNNVKEFCLFSDMIEYDQGCIWDRDRLIRLARRYKTVNIHVPIEETYLMRDNTELMKKVNLTREEECYKIEITISEESRDEYTWRLEYIDVDR
jgi:hypothetical protein